MYENPIACIIATGSEVSLALEIASVLKKEDLAIEWFPWPCSSVFDRQSESYKKTVLPENIKKISIEAGSTDLWYKYTGERGLTIGINNSVHRHQPKFCLEELKIRFRVA